MTGGATATYVLPSWYRIDSCPMMMAPQSGSGTGITMDASVSTLSCFHGICNIRKTSRSCTEKISLQAYPYTYSLLREITFKVYPLSNYALLSPIMLPLLETFLELLLWNSLQCCHHMFFWTSSISLSLQPFKADFIFGNTHKLFGAKSREKGICSISVIDFLARNCLTESTL